MIPAADTLDGIVASLQPLLAPIPGEFACGVALREGPELRDLKLVRGEDPSPRRGHRGRWDPDWRRIAAMAEELLAAKSKDLQVAAWLAEAWVHTDRLDGLIRGLVLIRELVQRYGSQLHPRAADDAYLDDMAEAAARLNWLDLALPPHIPSLGRTETDAAGIAAQLEQVTIAKSALAAFTTSWPHVSTPRMLEGLDQLAHHLELYLGWAREREEREEQRRALMRRQERMSMQKREALLERERVVRTLHNVLLFLARDDPDSLAPLLVERALRLFHKRADELAKDLEDEWYRLGRWSRHGPLPYPTVFDDPAAGDNE
jgi:hypothetical protein